MYYIVCKDDWVELYKGDELLAAGNYLNVDDVLDALNLPYVKKYEMDEMGE